MSASLESRRRRERRLLVRGVGVAVLLHAAAFAYWSGLRAEPFRERDGGMSMAPDSAAAGYGTRLSLLFGPPTIRAADGSATREPETRFLEAERLVQIYGPCPTLFDADRMPVRGTVRLAVNASGRVDSVRIERATPELCTDELLVRVAADLLYEWLPSDRHPAPVHLVQPVVIREAHR